MLTALTTAILNLSIFKITRAQLYMYDPNLTEEQEEKLFWEKETTDINGREIDEEEQQFWQMVKFYITCTLGIVDSNTQIKLDKKLSGWRNHVYQKTNLSEKLILLFNSELGNRMSKMQIAKEIYLFTRNAVSYPK